MNFDEYEKQRHKLYSDLAKIVRDIVDKAIRAKPELTPPQAFQARAKTASSLRRRLEEKKALGADNIEEIRKDLAGVRLIFYANGDVERFEQSRILTENFEIDWEASRTHTPTKENNQNLYRARHYVVSLKENRTSLPEYSQFAGLRCEIQVQTILNHAWSETTHDLLYKREDWSTYGARFLEAIQARMNRLMNEYLLPAGYELDKALQDYRRLKDGKALFDQGPIEALGKAASNNERVDLLNAIRENVLPFHEKLDDVHPLLIQVVSDAVKNSRSGAGVDVPTETTFGQIGGKTREDVLRSAMRIISATRYRDIKQVLELMVDSYVEAASDEERKIVADTLREYSKHDLNAWRQVGPSIQQTLIDAVERLDEPKKESAVALLGEVWSAALGTEVTGTEATSHDSVTFSRGSVIASPHLEEIRKRALSAILQQLTQAETAELQKAWYDRAHNGLRLPHHGEYSDELSRLVLANTVEFLRTVRSLIGRLNFQLLEEIDEDMLWLNRRTKQLVQVLTDDRSRALGRSVLEEVAAVHDALESNAEFVRYKTLVGFRGTFPIDWEGEEFDYKRKEEYRLSKIDGFVASIGEQNLESWVAIIERSTRADGRDMATFPMFGKFLRKLGKEKPELAATIFERLSPSAQRFLPAFLAGMSESEHTVAYNTFLDRYRNEPEHLAAVAMHYRAVPLNLAYARDALKLGIENDQPVTVIEVLTLAVEHHQSAEAIATLFEPALDYLIGKRDARWVHTTWYSEPAGVFFSELSGDLLVKVLHSLSQLREIGYDAERILGKIAKLHASEVWDFLASRYRQRDDRKSEELANDSQRFEAVPFSLSELGPALARDMAVAVGAARSNYNPDVGYFRFEMGHVLADVARGVPDDFIDAMSGVIAKNGDDDIDFALDVLINFNGSEKIHPLLRDIVALRSTDKERIGSVERCIESTGVVSGEFGFVEAYREKMELMKKWLADDREPVTKFADLMVKHLERLIAAEQLRAEQRLEMRKRDFDDPKRGGNSDDDNPEGDNEPDDEPEPA